MPPRGRRHGSLALIHPRLTDECLPQVNFGESLCNYANTTRDVREWQARALEGRAFATAAARAPALVPGTRARPLP